jgi:hypothetical protein
MRKLILCFALLFAVSAFGQSATLNSPEVRPNVTKFQVADFAVQRDCACAHVTVEYLTSADALVRKHRFDIETANLAAFLTAIGSPRANETGVAGRRMNYRILGFLLDNGYASGITLVP